MRITLIYLAAGNSRRFGSNKLFYEIDGKQMYLHLLERLAAICGRHMDWNLLVVTQYQEIFDMVQKVGIDAVFSPDSEKGMSYTIKTAMSAAIKNAVHVAGHSEPDGILQVMAGESGCAEADIMNLGQETVTFKPDAYAFFVADQPYLTEETAESFLTEMERKGAKLGSVRCKGVPGNPTWFAAEYRGELLALEGDCGGRAMLKKHPEEVVYYEVAKEKELRDIDKRNSEIGIL